MVRYSNVARQTRLSLLLAVGLMAASTATVAQDDWGEESPCVGALDDTESLATLLAAVPKYGRTYVLAYDAARSEEVQGLGLDAPAWKEIEVGVFAAQAGEDGAAAAMVQDAGLTAAPAPFTVDAAGSLIEAVLTGSLDAAVLWGPLAGLAVQELDFDYALSLETVGLPTDAPLLFAPGEELAPDDTGCADEIAGFLEGYGVVPAEKLVPLDIRTLLHLPAPERDPARAAAGAPLYAEHCAKCHGANAVAATDALAPVDLLVSLQRFSFPGFIYIVLNGRSQNGMPGFRGSMTQQDVEQIYQYARERAHGTVGADTP